MTGKPKNFDLNIATSPGDSGGDGVVDSGGSRAGVVDVKSKTGIGSATNSSSALVSFLISFQQVDSPHCLQ